MDIHTFNLFSNHNCIHISAGTLKDEYNKHQELYVCKNALRQSVNKARQDRYTKKAAWVWMSESVLGALVFAFYAASYLIYQKQYFHFN
jgi:hypothetical protein